jgi:ArsR family transcriptional regulator
MFSTFKALADPTRLRLLAVLVHGEFTVQELTGILGTGQSRVSHHLKILTDAGLLSVKRQGTWGYYRLDGDNPFFHAIRSVVEARLRKETAPGDKERMLATLEKRRHRSRDFFDRHARQWDNLVRNLLPMADYEKELLACIPRVSVVLEVGVGTGNLLAGLRGRAAKVIGVDHSSRMLELARQRVAEAGLDGVELRLGEMRHLPVADGAAQWIVLNMVLHHAPHPQQVFYELARVLPAGGGISIADLCRHDQDWVREQMADQWLGFERQELETWLAAAGFEPVFFNRVSGNVNEQDTLLLSAVKIRQGMETHT